LLDEPTANLDPATERQCLKAIGASGNHRMTLLVSHSDQARAIADKTIFIGANRED
jgi:ATP-binding cassette subfamily C protein CydD